jgi:hypothetical protein
MKTMELPRMKLKQNSQFSLPSVLPKQIMSLTLVVIAIGVALLIASIGPILFGASTAYCGIKEQAFNMKRPMLSRQGFGLFVIRSVRHFRLLNTRSDHPIS